MTNLVDQSQRALGKELRIGPLGYGCWRLVNMPVAEARARIEHVLSLGMNLIDTADVYGLDWGGTAFGSAEELLGEVLQDAPGLREQMVLASKGGMKPLGAQDILKPPQPVPEKLVIAKCFLDRIVHHGHQRHKRVESHKDQYRKDKQPSALVLGSHRPFSFVAIQPST